MDKKLCSFCEWNETKHELCEICKNLAEEEEIIKENNVWVAKNKIGKESRFFDENKHYRLKRNIFSKCELIFYSIAKETLNQKSYIIDPQVNMQAIISTYSNTRNEELYRNIDFGIFTKDEYFPIVLVEINDFDHYYNPMKIERDKSVRSILKVANIPLIVINNEELEELDKKIIQKMLNKVVKFCENNPCNNCFTLKNYKSLLTKKIITKE